MINKNVFWFSQGGKVKLYKVKTEAPVQELTSGNSNYR